MSGYGRDQYGNLWQRVGGESEGCGCLIGAIVVLGVLGVAITLIGKLAASPLGPAWIGLHVYSFFNGTCAPEAYLAKPDYFYACAGLLFVFAVGTALATIVALLGRSARAARIAGVLFVMTVVAFIATIITHQAFFPHTDLNCTIMYSSSGRLT